MKIVQSVLKILMVGLWALCIVSCKEASQEPSPPPDPRDELTGIFEMTKLENGQVYLMKVEKMGDLCVGCDSLRFINYGDLFNFKNVRIPYADWSNYLDAGYINPITNKHGKRWKLNRYGSIYEPEFCNMVRGDSIKICFTLSNQQYYQEDNVPLIEDSALIHVGKRIARVQ